MDVQQIHHIPSTNTHTNISARTSENLDSNILENIEESQRVNKISTNYIDSENHLIERLQLSTLISALLDLENKSMAECIKHSSWIKCKKIIEAELHSLKRNERYSHQLYLLLVTFFPWDQNGFSSVKGMKTMR
jgi:hypothetical protein